MSDYLPEAVVVEILYRLPPKTLVRCSTVCKAWYSIIKSHDFISSHLKRSLSNPTPSLFFLSRDSGSTFDGVRYTIHSATAPYPYRPIAEFEPPSDIPVRRAWSLIGSLHGIVCLTDDHDNDDHIIILWNPVIRRHVLLPTPFFTRETLGRFLIHHGFGFDSKNDDYKVLRVCCLSHGNGNDHIPPRVEVYSLNQGSWRIIDASNVELKLFFGRTNCFLHGNVHWLACGEVVSHSCECVVMFNVEEEKFKMMELPEELITALQSNLDISVIDGCLSVIECSIYASHIEENTCCKIWMMREYGVAKSWSKMYNINLEGPAYVMGFRISGEVSVVLDEGSVSLYSFQPKSNKMEHLTALGATERFCACGYTWSLVLFDNKRCIVQGQNDKSAGLDSEVTGSKQKMQSESWLKNLSAWRRWKILNQHNWIQKRLTGKKK